MITDWLRAYTLSTRGTVLESVEYGLRHLKEIHRKTAAAVFLHPDVKPATWPDDLPPVYTDPTLSRTLVYFEEGDLVSPDAGGGAQLRLL